MGGVKALLASRNMHKLEELRAALPDWEMELLAAETYPAEEGRTYFENARAKARFGRMVVGLGSGAWVLGEDSGIEVNGLAGRPGVESARFAAGDPVGALLRELEGLEGDARLARYVCELVCVSPEHLELRGTGVLEGRIAARPSGSEGFGYDPIFVPAGEARTVAGLGDVWKRQHSHRARAAGALVAALAAADMSGPDP